MGNSFRLVSSVSCLLGESPAWDADRDRLYWIDSTGGAIYESAADGSHVRVWKLPGMVGSIALGGNGTAIVTVDDAICMFDFVSGHLTEIERPTVATPARFNDGKTDRQGRFITGYMDLRLIDPETRWLRDQVKSPCCVYSVGFDLRAESIIDDMAITNGPCFSPDGTTMYIARGWYDEIMAYDYDAVTGVPSNGRLFASYVADKGVTGMAKPDGATVDSEGCVWSTAVYGGELRRFAPDGSLDRRISTPVLKPTSIAFGGPNMDTLYITSMMDNSRLPFATPSDGPLGGRLFALDGIGVTGIVETRFRAEAKATLR